MMIMKNTIVAVVLFIASCVTNVAKTGVSVPKPILPVPTANQLAWQKMEYYAFIHFSINTFTDQEWGYGDKSPRLFNPANLDCRQWARICKAAGMKGIILTVKHHDGFCLWPSKYTEYSVKNSPWRQGKGDLVRELAAACKEYGLKLGIYLSPWDRNRADYGEASYITYFRNQLKELMTNYGEIFEIWFDGANGGTGYYGGARERRSIDHTTYYDWENTYKLIRRLQPHIVIWADRAARADLRWCGNEDGSIGETNWSLLPSEGEMSAAQLRDGVEDGDKWVPGEVNVSIRPGWFYHSSEDDKVKSLPKLMDIYYHSRGRNAPLLLNVPIDKHGLIHSSDEKALMEFAAAVKRVFAHNLALKARVTATNVRGKNYKYRAANVTDASPRTYWATDDSVKTASLTVDFGKPVTFNRFLVQEYIALGQRVKAFNLEALVDGKWRRIAAATTVGYRRVLCFPAVTAETLRLNITAARGCPLISNIGVYNAALLLTQPEIKRGKEGDITIVPGDKDSQVFYTLDGKMPEKNGLLYTKPIKTDGRKVYIRVRAFDPVSEKYSPEAHERFDISHSGWMVINTDNEAALRVIDGDKQSGWSVGKDVKLPMDLIIDLGETHVLKGFKYLPFPSNGIITQYQFLVSEDNKHWQVADEGEFSNIVNNPVEQVKTFKSVNARYINLRAMVVAGGGISPAYREIDVITE